MSPSFTATVIRRQRIGIVAITALLLVSACGENGPRQFPPPDVSVAPVVLALPSTRQVRSACGAIPPTRARTGAGSIASTNT